MPIPSCTKDAKTADVLETTLSPARFAAYFAILAKALSLIGRFCSDQELARVTIASALVQTGWRGNTSSFEKSWLMGGFGFAGTGMTPAHPEHSNDTREATPPIRIRVFLTVIGTGCPQTLDELKSVRGRPTAEEQTGHFWPTSQGRKSRRTPARTSWVISTWQTPQTARDPNLSVPLGEPHDRRHPSLRRT